MNQRDLGRRPETQRNALAQPTAHEHARPAPLKPSGRAAAAQVRALCVDRADARQPHLSSVRVASEDQAGAPGERIEPTIGVVRQQQHRRPFGNSGQSRRQVGPAFRQVVHPGNPEVRAGGLHADRPVHQGGETARP